MSDYSQGPGWWQASDGKWYAPQTPAPGPAFPQTPPPGVPAYGVPQGVGTASGLPSTKGFGVTSMVLGIVSLVFCWCWPVGGTCAIVGLPFGAVALSKIAKGEGDPAGKGMATAGLVMCIISIALILIFVIAWGGAIGGASS